MFSFVLCTVTITVSCLDNCSALKRKEVQEPSVSSCAPAGHLHPLDLPLQFAYVLKKEGMFSAQRLGR